MAVQEHGPDYLVRVASLKHFSEPEFVGRLVRGVWH